jgi:hypothetical protein
VATDQTATREERISYTPGPWNAGDGKGNGSLLMVYCDDSLGCRIADCSNPGHLITQQRAEANTKLIAAAPELLQSVREILGWYVEGGHAVPRVFIDRANAAIAKAEGRS